MQSGCVFGVDVGDGMNDGEKVSLDLEVVLCDEYGNDSMGSVRCDESFKQNSVFLPQEWKPGLRR